MLAGWSMGSEEQFVESLSKELKQELLAGLDMSPSFSRSSSRPDLYPAFRAGGIEAAAFIGNFNAKKSAAAAGTLRVNSFTLKTSSWKLPKESVDSVMPKIKDKHAQ